MIARAEKLELELVNRQQAWKAIKNELYPFLAAVLRDRATWVLTVALKKRTSPQNRRYWGRGVLAQIAEEAKVNGRKFSAEVWHEQMKRQFIGVEELPNGQIVGKSSKDLSTKEFSEFCDLVEAFAATELGVVFVDLEPKQ